MRLLLGLFLLPLAAAPTEQVPPDAFVDLAEIAPSIEIDMRYAGERNFTGRPVEGYEAPRCLLTRKTAQALARVQTALEADGLGLLVFDCYRPQRAVDDFAAWARTDEDSMKPYFYPRVEKARLFALQYIAHRSGHSRGSTVDLTLTRPDPAAKSEARELADCKTPIPGDPGPLGLDMGTPWDCFSEASATASEAVSAAAQARRQRLLSAMSAAGFRNYRKEWWHYTLREEPFPKTYFDFPVR